MLHHSNASLCGRLFTLLFLLLTDLAAGPGAFGAHPADKTEEPKKAVVTVGVQSSLEPVFFTGSFGPTMAYLRKTFPELEFRSEVLGDDALLLSIESSGFDFVFMDSGFYVFSADQVEMRDIVMQTSPQSANPAESVGSAVIVRADDARFRRIDDLRGRSVAADSPESLGGWNILQGVIRERGYDPEAFFGEVLFTRSQYPGVAALVANGSVDAGVLKACELERLMSEHDIAPDAFRVLDERKNAALACRHSTPLYPDVILAASAGADPAVVKDVARALLEMPVTDDGYAWGIGAKTSRTARLYRDLRIGPYRYLREVRWETLWENYRPWFAVFAALLFFTAFHVLRTNRLVQLRTRQLRAALIAKDRLETEARKSRDRLYQMERAGVVSQMSAMLAHELRQPVYTLTNFAGGMAQYVSKRYGGDAMVKKASEGILSAAERISQIVDRVRSYARQKEARRVRIELSALTERTLATFRHTTASDGVEVLVSGEGKAALSGDPLELELVLLNLLRNAASAMADQPAPRRIRLSWSATQEPGLVTVLVEDDGPVLSDEAFAALSHPVASLKPEGLGLGLSLCRTIVERHGGELRFARRSDRPGLRVTVVLPAADA